MDLCVVVLCLVVSGLVGDGAWSAMEVEPSTLLLLFFSSDDASGGFFSPVFCCKSWFCGSLMVGFLVKRVYTVTVVKARGGNLMFSLTSVYPRTAGVSLTGLACRSVMVSLIGLWWVYYFEDVGAVLLGFEGTISLGISW
ncbi:hypothetical protein DY000_02012916 [Brassica cretica]|uniref:Secreted protein n=1 Tax=Brassica cretica TaxID=69181 RepID=A0ABQ7D5P0_BRACR|nr:hypothetical protein DY000_02012916 [Brassica cretica]